MNKLFILALLLSVFATTLLIKTKLQGCVNYTRGHGYTWKFGDPMGDTLMFSRCEKDNGKGQCEKYGLIVYPKCKAGYKPFGCCVCKCA